MHFSSFKTCQGSKKDNPQRHVNSVIEWHRIMLIKPMLTGMMIDTVLFLVSKGMTLKWNHKSTNNEAAIKDPIYPAPRAKIALMKGRA